MLRSKTRAFAMVHGGSGFSLLLQVLSIQDAGGADVNQDWLTLGTAITTDTVTNLAVGGLPIAVTHVRVYTTTPVTPPKVLLSARSEGSG